MRDDPAVVALVNRARDGDQAAWNAIVDRYAALVWSVCRRYRLAPADAEEIAGTVWLRLVEHLDSLREPAALPGWIAQTTHHACLHLVRMQQRQRPTEAGALDLEGRSDDAAALDHELLVSERRQALRSALAELSERCRELLGLMFADPAPTYEEIGARLDMKVGAIGPTRGRCLDRLRRTTAMTAFLT